MTTPNAEWLSIKQVAEALGRSERHVSQLIRDGRIEARFVKRDGARSVRIHRSFVYSDPTPKVLALPVISEARIEELAEDIADRALRRIFQRLGYTPGQAERMTG